jgi:hypothetical protein
MSVIKPNEKIFIPYCFGKSIFRTYKYLTKEQKKSVNKKTLTLEYEKGVK